MVRPCDQNVSRKIGKASSACFTHHSERGSVVDQGPDGVNTSFTWLAPVWVVEPAELSEAAEKCEVHRVPHSASSPATLPKGSESYWIIEKSCCLGFFTLLFFADNYVHRKVSIFSASIFPHIVVCKYMLSTHFTLLKAWVSDNKSYVGFLSISLLQ